MRHPVDGVVHRFPWTRAPPAQPFPCEGIPGHVLRPRPRWWIAGCAAPAPGWRRPTARIMDVSITENSTRPCAWRCRQGRGAHAAENRAVGVLIRRRAHIDGLGVQACRNCGQERCLLRLVQLLRLVEDQQVAVLAASAVAGSRQKLDACAGLFRMILPRPMAVLSRPHGGAALGIKKSRISSNVSVAVFAGAPYRSHDS